tara:strand:- start:1486 stop:2364 length:879 start_codon:yes stop_codon:yes gene_type:complete
MNIDLFGNTIENNPLLRDKFIEPPFSILDTKTGNWQRRKKLWRKLGIKSELGRFTKGSSSYDSLNRKKYSESVSKIASVGKTASIFDPALCEILYHWFCPKGGDILDPFAGGSVRGIVANYMGYFYTGIELRGEQVESNRKQAIEILKLNNQPQWYVGDSNKVLDELNKEYDFVFSCPPYANLEVYSELEGDISNMNYKDFLFAYESIISKSCKLLKVGGYACFVVGEVRNKKGDYIGFVPDTIRAFKKCGMHFYNEAILLNAVGSGSLRANNQMKNKKLVKIHQNVLVFKK